MRLARQRVPYLTMVRADYYGPANHEAASKFLDQKLFRLNIQQRLSSSCNRLALTDPVR
jgi:hypothetical protein